MTKKRMLADVLWDAANVHLKSAEELTKPTNREQFSCHAVLAASGESFAFAFDSYVHQSKAMSFLRSLGCDFNSTAWDLDAALDWQGVRYMWLLLAMHVAEDEGITV